MFDVWCFLRFLYFFTFFVLFHAFCSFSAFCSFCALRFCAFCSFCAFYAFYAFLCVNKPVLNKIITTQEYVKYDFVTPLNAPFLRGIFVDSFNMLYDYLRYLLQSINPFDTSVLVRFSQVKISKKTFFLRLLWKVPYNLILIWRIQKSNSFSQIFSFSSSFLSRFIKNVLKNGSKFFSIDFHEKFPIT